MTDLGVWRVRTTDGRVISLASDYDDFATGIALFSCVALEGANELGGRTMWISRAHIMSAWREETDQPNGEKGT